MRALSGALRLLLVAASLVSSAGCEATPEPRDPGGSALERWDDLPVLGESKYLQFSSHDRLKRLDYPVADPGNKDPNNFLAICGARDLPLVAEQDDPSLCNEGIQGFLIARVTGQSGYVSRVWLTAAPFYSTETIRIYADDLSIPAYEGRPADWSSRADPIFAEPLAGPRSGAVVSYLPIHFKHDLRIYLDRLLPIGLYYYHVNVQLDVPVEESFEAVPIAAEEQARLDLLLNSPGSNAESRLPRSGSERAVTLSPGETSDAFDLKGPAIIRKLSFSFEQPTLDQLRSLKLEMQWDGEPVPSIQLPLSAFFGTHLAIQPYSTLPFEVSRRGSAVVLSSYFPMPFRKNAVIRLSNTGLSAIDVQASVRSETGTPDGPWGHFGAGFNETSVPLAPNALHPIASLTGRGKYVGTFMFMEGHKDTRSVIADAFNFLEGDEFGTIDGELRIPGTGTEDYFNAGFYFLKGLFDSSFAGLNVKESDAATGSGKISTYRWHVLSDEINFSNSFDLRIEYGANRPDLADRYASVAYYYLSR